MGIFPNEAAVLRLAGAVLLEVHDEWAIAERRYLAEGSMSLLDRVGDDGSTKEVDGAKGLYPKFRVRISRIVPGKLSRPAGTFWT